MAQTILRFFKSLDGDCIYQIQGKNNEYIPVPHVGDHVFYDVGIYEGLVKRVDHGYYYTAEANNDNEILCDLVDILVSDKTGDVDNQSNIT